MNDSMELVKKGFDAFAVGDMATLDELLADDVVWVSEGPGVISGRFEGKPALFASWAKIPAETQGTFRQDVVEMFSDDKVVVAVTEATADRKGKHLERVRGVIIFVVHGDKVTQARVIPGDPDQNADFWAE